MLQQTKFWGRPHKRFQQSPSTNVNRYLSCEAQDYSNDDLGRHTSLAYWILSKGSATSSTSWPLTLGPWCRLLFSDSLHVWHQPLAALPQGTHVVIIPRKKIMKNLDPSVLANVHHFTDVEQLFSWQGPKAKHLCVFWQWSQRLKSNKHNAPHLPEL